MELYTKKLGKVAVTVEKDPYDSTKEYDRLTIVEVQKEGTTYISRVPVPAGISINDRNYWLPVVDTKALLAKIEEYANNNKHDIELDEIYTDIVKDKTLNTTQDNINENIVDSLIQICDDLGLRDVRADFNRDTDMAMDMIGDTDMAESMFSISSLISVIDYSGNITIDIYLRMYSVNKVNVIKIYKDDELFHEYTGVNVMFISSATGVPLNIHSDCKITAIAFDDNGSEVARNEWDVQAKVLSILEITFAKGYFVQIPVNTNYLPIQFVFYSSVKEFVLKIPRPSLSIARGVDMQSDDVIAFINDYPVSIDHVVDKSMLHMTVNNNSYTEYNIDGFTLPQSTDTPTVLEFRNDRRISRAIISNNSSVLNLLQ